MEKRGRGRFIWTVLTDSSASLTFFSPRLSGVGCKGWREDRRVEILSELLEVEGKSVSIKDRARGCWVVKIAGREYLYSNLYIFLII